MLISRSDTDVIDDAATSLAGCTLSAGHPFTRSKKHLLNGNYHEQGDVKHMMLGLSRCQESSGRSCQAGTPEPGAHGAAAGAAHVSPLILHATSTYCSVCLLLS